MVVLLKTMVDPFATTETNLQDVKTNLGNISMNAPAVGSSHMEHKSAISLRSLHPQTPLVANQWHEELTTSHLLGRYSCIPLFIQKGALASIPRIIQTFTPLNKDSTELL